MKTMKAFAVACLLSAFLLPATSCSVMVKKDNGKHKGWYKNTNNPHNPASSKTTGSGNKTKTTVKTNGSGTKIKVKNK